MSRLGSAALAGACLLGANAAHAHAVAGARVFPVTLTIDDPGVADEASLPTFTALRPAPRREWRGGAGAQARPHGRVRQASPPTKHRHRMSG